MPTRDCDGSITGVGKGAKDPDDCRRKYKRPDPEVDAPTREMAAVEDSGLHWVV
jgi:hypothetical protein